jgi:precorrin-4/cobalt-precorrin-4 C11-methyltransferase
MLNKVVFMKSKVIFIGAGPGDPDLITVKGRKVIEKADTIIYAGSLVNKDVLAPRKEECDVHNSAYLNLEETIDIMKKAIDEDKLVARVHTGDPAIYGAIGEQIRELKKLNIEYEIIPGVSSLFGTASALEAELTIPEVSQSVIITRPAGRTPKKELESIRSFSKHQATMCIFLGISMIDKVVDELLEGYTPDTPVAVVKKATWPDQEIIRGTLNDIAGKVKEANITKTAMIVVGDVLDPGDFTPSKLYDANFKHEYR